MSVTTRRATAADAALVADHNWAMALETEGIGLDAETVQAGVTALLADASKGFYLLAERDGALVGQLMVTYEWSDWRNGVFYWIQSVYVRPEARRTGVYRALYAELHGEAEARQDVCGIRLYVHHDNRRAMATYDALGMDAAEYRMYEVDFVLTR